MAEIAAAANNEAAIANEAAVNAEQAVQIAGLLAEFRDIPPLIVNEERKKELKIRFHKSFAAIQLRITQAKQELKNCIAHLREAGLAPVSSILDARTLAKVRQEVLDEGQQWNCVATLAPGLDPFQALELSQTIRGLGLPNIALVQDPVNAGAVAAGAVAAGAGNAGAVAAGAGNAGAVAAGAGNAGAVAAVDLNVPQNVGLLQDPGNADANIDAPENDGIAAAAENGA